MASRRCRVSFTDAERVEHAVEVSAATLYEACVLALAEFRRVGFVDVFGPATQPYGSRYGALNHAHCLGREAPRQESA